MTNPVNDHEYWKLDEEVDHAVDQVHDIRSFVQFLLALSRNWDHAVSLEKENPSDPYSSMYGWEHSDPGALLDAAAQCTIDNDFLPNAKSETTADVWNLAARIILAGKYYE